MADFESSFAKLSLKAKLVKIAESKRNKPLAIPEELYNKLYDYQKEGIRWLFQLYERGKGGILGKLNSTSFAYINFFNKFL